MGSAGSAEAVDGDVVFIHSRKRKRGKQAPDEYDIFGHLGFLDFQHYGMKGCVPEILQLNS